MTDKRFTINNDMDFNDKVETYELNCIVDNNHKTFYFIADSIQNVQLFIKQLNELAEENEQLKKELDKLKLVNEMLSMDFSNSEHELLRENEQLKEQLSEAKTDEKQLGISFMGYKMKLIEVLQKKYDKVKGKTLYADVYTEIAEEMGVDLE